MKIAYTVALVVFGVQFHLDFSQRVRFSDPQRWLGENSENKQRCGGHGKVEFDGRKVKGHCQPRPVLGYGCCSAYGFCGVTDDYCNCEKCIRFIG